MLLHLKKIINLTLQQAVLDLTARFPAHASLSPSSNNPLESSVPDSGPGRNPEAEARNGRPRPKRFFTNLGFPAIRGFPLQSPPFGVKTRVFGR